MTLSVGHVLQNRYRIIASLGQGGMGSVYRVRDERLNVDLALKEMTPQPGLSTGTLAQLRQQFRQEAAVLARLDHPHLVRVTDFFEERGNVYLVMHLIVGESLSSRIDREGALPEGEVLAWADQMLDAIEYCHTQGIIHRDVKPQNVIIRPDGQIVLVDFGLVKLWDPSDPHTRTALRGMGTPEYAPPEQYGTQPGHTDPRSDIYGLGATLYHALTGVAPMTANDRMALPDQFPSVRQLNPQVSTQTEATVMRAMALPIANRFDSAAGMRSTLSRSTPVAAPPSRPTPAPSLPPRAPSAAPAWYRRVPVWAWVPAGVAAVAGLVVCVAVVLGGLGARTAAPASSTPTPSPPASTSMAIVPTAAAASLATPTRSLPTGTPVPDGCLEASFVSETVPDGTRFDRGEPFVKSLVLRNSGTCDWPADTVLIKVSSEMGGADSVAVGAVAVGETVEIKVDMTAPEEDGSFTSMWALTAGSTQLIELWTVITVEEGEAPTVSATLPTGGFELGGHVRDLEMPHADKMRYAGMTWAKAEIRYPADATSIISAFHSKGFKVQLTASGTPSMVTEAGYEQRYADWVSGMASAGADAIEIWSEPNIELEWQSGSIDPAAYTRLLCASYSAIKAANPNTIVISAAPAPTGFFGGCGGSGCDDLPFLQGMADAGAVECLDYAGAQQLAGATSPSARSGHPADGGSGHHSWYFVAQTEAYYAVFGEQLWYTEMGYASQEGVPEFSTAWAWASGITNAQQATWLSEAAQLSVNTGMVRCIIVWNVDFPRAGDDPADGYAIIRPDGACPACDALHNVVGGG